jgi:catechol 2,3-dioxygenase-like lactoylglutathione lyase family enzyme
MVRITDPEPSRGFYEALGFTFAGDLDIIRDGQLEATNYFFSLGGQESVLELTYNHDGRTNDLGSGYGHIAVGVEDLDGARAAGAAGDRPGAPAVLGARRRLAALFRPGPGRLPHRADRSLLTIPA